MVKNFSQPWKKMADIWDTLTSPSRPSLQEIKIYKKSTDAVLRGRGRKKVLVVGSTPELRDLVASYPNVQVSIVDINLEMMLAMTELMKKKNPEEIWVRANWLEAPFPEKYFDLIIGDFTFENLPFELHGNFYKNIQTWLKDSGRYVERVMVYRKKHPQMTIAELEAACQKKPISNRLITFFWNSGIFYTEPSKKRRVHVFHFFTLLEAFKKSKAYPGSAIRKILKVNTQVYPAEKIWFIWDEDGFDAFSRKYWDKVSEECDRKTMNLLPIYRDMGPIFCWRKKT